MANEDTSYLATRRSEYDNLKAVDASAWSQVFCSGKPSLAERIAQELCPTNSVNDKYTTLLHGDVKSENLFSTTDESSIAFFDFQYVGLGLGVCDLAKLFTCSVPARLLPAQDGLSKDEEKLLRFYHERLQEVSEKRYSWDVFVKHWEMALLDWLRFQASWGMWGNTEWLEARCRGIVKAASFA